jgi:hypothetical protein
LDVIPVIFISLFLVLLVPKLDTLFLAAFHPKSYFPSTFDRTPFGSDLQVSVCTQHYSFCRGSGQGDWARSWTLFLGTHVISYAFVAVTALIVESFSHSETGRTEQARLQLLFLYP